MTDPLDLYHRAFNAPNPFMPKAGTYVGHQQQFENRQTNLSRLIEEAIMKRCPIPPEALFFEELPTPNRPGWKK
jgi:hypothetical protein